jgi:hypothetical protein
MPHNNPWFLITADEIGRLENHLQDIRQGVPEQHQTLILRALDILNDVQVRQP